MIKFITKKDLLDNIDALAKKVKEQGREINKLRLELGKMQASPAVVKPSIGGKKELKAKTKTATKTAKVDK